tara:strand:- start:1114 stop:2505 length:1392 start_codon:yes stop_codon:yes gene_type:complete
MEANTAVTTHKQFTNGNAQPPEPIEEDSELWQVLEPWPSPVGPEIIPAIESALKKHLFLSTEAALTCALWVAHADMFMNLKTMEPNFECTPRLGITAPFKGSGKTKLLTVLNVLTNHAVDGGLCSTAGFERLSAKGTVAFFMDEADKVFSHENSDMTKSLNAGWHSGQKYIKCNEKNEPVAFSLFSAVALAGISLPKRLCDTTLDRTILIKMVQAKAGQITEKYRRKKHKDKFVTLGRKLLRWINDHQQEIADYEPVFPDSVDGRDEEKWEPLVAIASIASPELARRAMNLALKSVSVNELTELDEMNRFMKSVLAVYDLLKPTLTAAKHNGVSSKGILPTRMAVELCNVHRHEEDDDRYWERYNSVKTSKYFKDEDMPIKAAQVTALFSEIDVSKGTINLGDGNYMDGFSWDEIVSKCSQYLPDSTDYVPGLDLAEGGSEHVSTHPHVWGVDAYGSRVGVSS